VAIPSRTIWLTESPKTSSLSKISALSIVPRHGTFSMRGAAPQDVASRFSVDYLLHGSVRRAGGRVRITADLTDAGQEQIWSERYDGTLDDIFKLQDHISRNIVEELRIKLLPDESATLSKRTTANANAYQMYLLGRSFFNRGLESRNLRFARQLFAKALEIDPDYAKAYAGMANCDSYLLFSNDASVDFEDVMRNCGKALDLDPQLADAHASRGLALLTANRNQEAEAEFERAMSLDPNSFETHYFWGQNCYAMGKHEEAATLFERASELLTSDYQAPTMYAAALLALARDDKAMAAAQEALRRIEREVSAHPDNANAYCFGAIELAVLGETERALSWAGHAGSLAGKDDYLVLYNLACCYTRMGKHEEAIDCLERQAFGVPIYVAFNLQWMRNDSDLAGLQEHPRFIALIDRLESKLRELRVESDQPR
jgi:adenylate cyclase